MEVAYRFFDNAKVTPAAIMTPHVAASQGRIAAFPVALLVQDTNELPPPILLAGYSTAPNIPKVQEHSGFPIIHAWPLVPLLPSS